MPGEEKNRTVLVNRRERGEIDRERVKTRKKEITWNWVGNDVGV